MVWEQNKILMEMAKGGKIFQNSCMFSEKKLLQMESFWSNMSKGIPTSQNKLIKVGVQMKCVWACFLGKGC